MKLDRGLVLDKRDTTIAVDTNQHYLINGGYRGVCKCFGCTLSSRLSVSIDRVLYPESRIAKIAEAASQQNPIVSLEDRIGLVNDATALAQAGMAKTSSALSLIKSFVWEKKCRICVKFKGWTKLMFHIDLGNQGMADAIVQITLVFGEKAKIRAGLKELRRVSLSLYRHGQRYLSYAESVYIRTSRQKAWIRERSEGYR